MRLFGYIIRDSRNTPNIKKTSSFTNGPDRLSPLQAANKDSGWRVGPGIKVVKNLYPVNRFFSENALFQMNSLRALRS